VTALLGGRTTVFGTAGGFLVRSSTGRAVVARDLGAVWLAILTQAIVDGWELPAAASGPATVPTPRSAVTSVVLVIEGQQPPPDAVVLDGRTWAPEGLVAELWSIASDVRPPLVSVSVLSTAVGQLLPHLRSHPKRPFTVRALHDGAVPASPARLAAGARYRHRLPALLAWLAALDGRGHPGLMQLRLPLGQGYAFELALIRGTVTTATVGTATEDDGGYAVLTGHDAAIEQSLTALLA